MDVTLFMHDLLSATLSRTQFFPLSSSEYLSVVKKAITFSSKIFQTLHFFYLFLRSCCCLLQRWVFHFLLRNSHQFALFARTARFTVSLRRRGWLLLLFHLLSYG